MNLEMKQEARSKQRTDGDKMAVNAWEARCPFKQTEQNEQFTQRHSSCQNKGVRLVADTTINYTESGKFDQHPSSQAQRLHSPHPISSVAKQTQNRPQYCQSKSRNLKNFL